MATKNKVFKYYCDPGHGWLAEKLADLTAVGVSTDQVSSCSYQRGQSVYLEEDCDAPVFIDAFKATFGHAPMIGQKHTDRSSHIRPYFHVAHSGQPVQYMRS